VPGAALAAALGSRWLFGSGRLLRALDIAAVAVVPLHVIGRVGCFLTGCCYGKPTFLPWGVTYGVMHGGPAPKGMPLHPAQLYESGLMLFAGALLYWVYLRRRPANGIVSGVYLVAYGGVRLLMEHFRGEVPAGVLAGITHRHLLAGAFAGLGVVLLAVLSRARHRRSQQEVSAGRTRMRPAARETNT